MASSTGRHAPIIIEKEIQLLQQSERNHVDEKDKCQQTKLSTKTLNLLMLGCENKIPYGPLEHTAQLFLDVIGLGAIQSSSSSSSTRNVSSIIIRMHIYNVQNMEYPNTDEWDQYDGILIPGSFSAAYDPDPWIEQLKLVIQTQIVPYHRKTLGVCFGHQIMAHSFSGWTSTADKSKEASLTMGKVERTTIAASATTFTERFDNNSGLAIPTPSGPRAGHFTMPLTFAGQELLLSEGVYPKEPRDSNGTSSGINTAIDVTTKNQQEVELYFTHGDMVSKIPDDIAVLLGGDDRIPIQSVAYFESIADVQQYKHAAATAATANDNHRLPSNDLDSLNTEASTSIKLPLPYAITFQAHPEYSSSMELGITRTLFQCMDAMETRRRGQEEQNDEHESHGSKSTTTTTTKRNYTIQSRDDAIQHFPHVQKDSIAIIARVGQIFGWF